MNKQYYVYYELKSKRIVCISNEWLDTYDASILVEYEDVKHFLSDAWHYRDYIIDYPVGSYKLAIISNADQGYNFKNSEYEVIEPNDDYAECEIEWDGPNSCWHFKLEPGFKKTYNGTLGGNLIFFVTLESDFDFLIRTMLINFEDMLNQDQISFPFESRLEHEISKISISSKIIFKNYKLTVYE